jgi:hypothetical protein
MGNLLVTRRGNINIVIDAWSGVNIVIGFAPYLPCYGVFARFHGFRLDNLRKL